MRQVLAPGLARALDRAIWGVEAANPTAPPAATAPSSATASVGGDVAGARSAGVTGDGLPGVPGGDGGPGGGLPGGAGGGVVEDGASGCALGLRLA